MVTQGKDSSQLVKQQLMSRLSPLPMRLNSSKNYWNDVQNIRREEEVKYFPNLYEGQQSFGATRYDAIYINVHVHLFVKMRTKVYDGEKEKQKNKNKNKCMVRFTTVKWSQTTWINLRGSSSRHFFPDISHNSLPKETPEGTVHAVHWQLRAIEHESVVK